MSGFLLDTNVPSELIRPQPEPKVKTWVAAQSLDTLFISAVSFGEFRKGITLRSPGKRRAELEAWIETDRQVCFPAAFCQSHDFVLYVDMMPVGVGRDGRIFTLRQPEPVLTVRLTSVINVGSPQTVSDVSGWRSKARL